MEVATRKIPELMRKAESRYQSWLSVWVLKIPVKKRKAKMGEIGFGGDGDGWERERQDNSLFPERQTDRQRQSLRERGGERERGA